MVVDIFVNFLIGLLTPGFVDVHAHWNGFSVQLPTRSWELETFLAYGITTLHNPSRYEKEYFYVGPSLLTYPTAATIGMDIMRDF